MWKNPFLKQSKISQKNIFDIARLRLQVWNCSIAINLKWFSLSKATQTLCQQMDISCLANQNDGLILLTSSLKEYHYNSFVNFQ